MATLGRPRKIAKLDGNHSTTSLISETDGRYRETGSMFWRPGGGMGGFIGSASGIHFARSVRSAFEAEQLWGSFPAQALDQDLVSGEEYHFTDTVSSSAQEALWRPHETSSPGHHCEEVSFSDLIVWSQSYFDNWHPAYPFVDTTSVLKTFQKLSFAPLDHTMESIDANDLVMVRAILSISLADRRQSPHKLNIKVMPSQLLFQSFDAAIRSVGTTLSASTDIRGLQAAISVQLFLVCMLKHNAAFRLGGLLVQMTFQTGLHRCPARYSSFTASDARMRKRVFWTVYLLDRSLSHILGLPLGIRDDDVDVCYPGDETHAHKSALDIPTDDHSKTFEFLVRHAKIKGSIVELCNKSIDHRQAGPQMTTKITASVLKWQNDLDIDLDGVEVSMPGFYTHHQTILSVLRHENIISLNRPLLAAPHDTAQSNCALHSCIAASRATIRVLYEHVGQNSRSPIVEDQPAPTPLLWPSFTWAVWQSAFIVIHAAAKGELPQSEARRLADQSIEVLEHIALRGTMWPSACAAAVRTLGKNLEKLAEQKTAQVQEPDSLGDMDTSVPTQDILTGVQLALDDINDTEVHGSKNKSRLPGHDASCEATWNGNSRGHGRLLPSQTLVAENVPFLHGVRDGCCDLASLDLLSSTDEHDAQTTQPDQSTLAEEVV